MQAIVETVFDIVYLCTVITLGLIMIRAGRGHRLYVLFGIMAVMHSILCPGRLRCVRRDWKIIRSRWELENSSHPSR